MDDASDTELPDLQDPPKISRCAEKKRPHRSLSRKDFYSDSSGSDVEEIKICGMDDDQRMTKFASETCRTGIKRRARDKQAEKMDVMCISSDEESKEIASAPNVDMGQVMGLHYDDDVDLEFGGDSVLHCDIRHGNQDDDGDSRDSSLPDLPGLSARLGQPFGLSSQRSATTASSCRSEDYTDGSQLSVDGRPTTPKRPRKSPQVNPEAKEKAKAKKVEHADKKLREKEEKELLKRKKDQERLEKKQQKDYEAAKKRTLQEAKRNVKPGECLKFITVILDTEVLKNSCGTAILENLQKSQVKYEIQSQPHTDIVTFWREVTEVKETEPMKLETVRRELLEEDIILLLPAARFAALVQASSQHKSSSHTEENTLRDYVIKTRRALENRKLTLLVPGMDKYFRDQKTREMRVCKKNAAAADGPETGAKGKRAKKKQPQEEYFISRLDVEEALIDSQIYSNSNVRFVESDPDVGKAVLQFTKAVAETPFKRERFNTGFSLYMDGSGSVKVSREGIGLSQAWRQQLQQFKNVSAEVSNAIMADYPSPRDLWESYQACSSGREAELLLQDIVVRRGMGVMATSRRIGKEMSRKLFQLITSADPELVIV